MASSPTSSSTVSNSISSSSSSSSSHPVFEVHNIKSLIPINLDYDNFLLWQTLFIPVLNSHEVLHHVDCSVTPPVFGSPEYIPWKKIDDKVVTWLNATVSVDILRHIIKPSKSLSARDTWLSIESLFHDHANAKYLQLKMDFSNLKKLDKSMTSYVQSLKTISDSLASIGHSLSDDDLVMQTLSGLPSEYDSFVTAVTARPPLPSFEQLRALLLTQELRVQASSPPPEKDSNQAFFSGHQRGRGNHNNGNRGRNRGRGGQNSSPRHDSSSRHSFTPRDGTFNQSRGRSNNNTSRSNNNNSRIPPPYSQNSFPGLLGAPPSHLQSPVQCQICFKNGHSGAVCRQRFNQAYTVVDLPQSFSAMNINALPPSTW